ncbi:MAG: phosphoglycerate kinase [Rickettsiales bacterium]|jgi:phosphoglycerate kinase|nr:phosphoglycerate kinase [Rickettsiales bacterium]
MFNRIKDCNVKGKTVFLRADMNVSIKNNKIIDDTRIKATLPTIEYLVRNGAKTLLTTHLGKAEGKGFQEEFSLKIVLERLKELLPHVKFNYSKDCVGEETRQDIKNTNFGEVILLENLRFHAEEEGNDPEFAKKLAALADIYVNDAFSTCHRKHSSMVGIPGILDSYAGINLEYELDKLEALVSNPERPVMVIVGGSKVSTKLELLDALVSKTDYVVVGGGMANTFLHANGVNVGNSLREDELKNNALELLKKAKSNSCEVILPVDVVVAKKVAENQDIKTKLLSDLEDDDIIVDIGEKTVQLIGEKLRKCKVVIWNGPVGIYEINPFNRNTDKLAQIIADTTSSGRIKSVAGGGDILAALNNANVADKFTYLSTAGGAFLKWLEKGILPAVEKLKK